MDWYEVRKMDNDLRAEDRSKAMAILNYMEKFSTYYLIRTLQKLFEMVHPVHKAIQSLNITITYAKSKIRTLERLLISGSKNALGAKQHFEIVVKEAIDLKVEDGKCPWRCGLNPRLARNVESENESTLKVN